jgi:hypothetical protein
MLNVVILIVMAGIVVALGSGLFFLVRDEGKTERTVISLSIRVGLSVLLLVLLAVGFVGKYLTPAI